MDGANRLTTMDKRQNLFVFDSKKEISEFLLRKWEAISREATERKGYVAVALSGGETPFDFYQRLGQSDQLPWEKTHLFLVDERFLPYDDQDSNWGMLRRTLLIRGQVPRENIHPIPTEASDLRTAARKYEEDLKNFFQLSEGELPEFDLILLGIGEDGHTASLFPGDPALKETSRLAVAVIPTKARHPRITLTLPVLNQGRNVIFLVSGKNKASVLERVIKRDASLPASLVNPESGNLFFVTDREASSALSA
jgi:6-phosphogluconolactonase